MKINSLSFSHREDAEQIETTTLISPFIKACNNFRFFSRIEMQNKILSNQLIHVIMLVCGRLPSLSPCQCARSNQIQTVLLEGIAVHNAYNSIFQRTFFFGSYLLLSLLL